MVKHSLWVAMLATMTLSTQAAVLTKDNGGGAFCRVTGDCRAERHLQFMAQYFRTGAGQLLGQPAAPIKDSCHPAVIKARML